MEHIVWKTVPIGNHKYEISNFGQLRRFYRGSKREKTEDRYKYITPVKHKKGYLKVGLGKIGTKYIHRLVAMCFLPVEEGKTDVNHKDGDKTNNHYSNLEWCTPQENNLHAWRILGVTQIKPVTLVNRKTREVFREFPSHLNAIKTLGKLRGFLVVPTADYSEEYVNAILDKKRKYTPRGYHPSSSRKLTPDEVRQIRKMIETGTRDYHIASMFGCDSGSIKAIKEEKTYRDVK